MTVPSVGSSSSGLTQDNIEARLIALLPSGWFSDGTAASSPILNAVISGAASVFYNAYSLVQFAKNQVRLGTSSGGFLDLAAYDFFGFVVKRFAGETDGIFAARIEREVLRERVTRLGMTRALQDLTGYQPSIFEPWNTADTGFYGSPFSGPVGGSIGYFTIGVSGIGIPASPGVSAPGAGYGMAGAYGSMLRPAEVDITVWRAGGGGTPGVVSYHVGNAGYGQGAMVEYGTASTSTGGVQDADIIATVAATKPMGVKVNLSITG